MSHRALRRLVPTHVRGAASSRVALMGLLIFGAATVSAQIPVGFDVDCVVGSCDANTGDEGGDHHNVDLGQHLAEARAQGNGALHRTAFAEVGLRFRPCFTGPASLLASDIHIVGHLRGFGGGPVIRGDVEVRAIVRDTTDDLELSNDVVYYREEDGQVGTTVNFNVDDLEDHATLANLVEGHVYEYVVRVRARKWGLNGRSNFQTGDRGVSVERFRILPNPADSDGDGLPDHWELTGVDTNCDDVPELDLAALGATPGVKDVFLELDWMTGQQPTRAAVAAVQQAFSLAPSSAGGVDTPGQGIRLWVDTGDLTDPQASEDGAGPGTCGDGIDNGGGDAVDALDLDCLVGDPVFSSLPGGGNLGGGNGFPVSGIPSVNVDTDDDGESDLQETKQDPARGNFDPNRTPVFRYAVNSVAAGAVPAMGGQAGGNDFILFNQNAGLLMHELGHTLGLQHGGPDDETNCKPNHVSVMNYRFQGGIMVAGGLGNGQDLDGDGTADGFILDYAPPRFPNGRGLAVLASIDETAWSENVVQDVSDSTNLTAWTGPGQVLSPPARLDQRPDWNIDSDTADSAPPAIDFNTALFNPAADEAGATGGTCNDGLDNDGDGNVDIADTDCTGNDRCALPANANVTMLTGADDWSGLDLDPRRALRTDPGDLPLWVDEQTEEDSTFVHAALQTTDLAISPKVATPDPTVAGQPLTYSMTVENRGPRPAVEVEVHDTLDARLHFLGGDPGCELADGVVTCAVGSLGVGARRQIEIRTRVSVEVACADDQQFAQIQNTARVVNVQGHDVDPSNDAARVESRVLCARYEYAAKFVCGEQVSPEDPRLVPGSYRTVTNIHNPNDDDTYFFKKLAFAFPPVEQRPGEVVPIGIDRLAYDEALKVDCTEVGDVYAVGGAYREGYLVVQSPRSLDVDAVYTVGSPVGAESVFTSVDVERIDERERRPGPRPDLVVLPRHPEPPFDPRFGVQLPEGVPNALYCGDNGPSGGPARTVDAIVRNVGMGDAAPATLRISFQGAGPEDVVIGALSAGAETAVSVPIPRGCYGPGACTFDLDVDAGDVVTETDETNNDDRGLCLSPAG